MAVFSVGQERLPPSLIRALALQKMAAASANERLGCLDNVRANAIIDAAREVLQGHFDDHFPLSVWQTGSGTQTNMNGNEVIANRANEMIHVQQTGERASILGTKSPIHPNDHVNCSQSSNDSFPTMMHIAAQIELQQRLIPSLSLLKEALECKEDEFRLLTKIGRTHLMDAVPMTMGQAFGAFAQQISHHIARVKGSFERLRELPQGGTAVGSGLNAPLGFDRAFCEELNYLIETLEQYRGSGIFSPAKSKFEAMGSHDAMVEVSGVLNGIAASLLKMATDLRFLSSGPRCGLGELIIPHDGLTSSIMPGKVNPTLAEMMSQIAFQVMGNHTTITMAGAAGGHFELNVAKPVIIYNLLQSITLLAEGIPRFVKNLVTGLEANEKTLKRNVENSLLQVTALNPHIGYDKVSKIVKKAMEEDLRPRDAAVALGLVSIEDYDRWTDPLQMNPSLSNQV